MKILLGPKYRYGHLFNQTQSFLRFVIGTSWANSKSA